MEQRTLRIHGLDTLRALAITLVVLHHYVLFVSGTATFGAASEMGWAGVDLFFALSGYLIGNQIFAALGRPAGLALGRFYLRRLLRTVPSFYAVVALFALWPAWRGAEPMLPLWEYLTFTQNVLLEPGTAFSHAWSLCIEEQFYLALPASALAGAALGRAGVRARWAWGALALAFAAGMAVRAAIWRAGPPGPGWQHYYYQHIYYATWCRFDELLAGVALAFARHRHPVVWRRALVHGNAWLVAGAAASAGAWALFLDDRLGLAATVFGYPLLALGCALLVLAALAPGSLLARVRVPGAGRLALWSYAVYLTHKQVCVLVAGRLRTAGFGAEHPVTIVVALAASLLAGWLLYRIVERPFLQLRARWTEADATATTSAPQICN